MVAIVLREDFDAAKLRRLAPGSKDGAQARRLSEALAKGTPNARRIALTAVSDKVREVI